MKQIHQKSDLNFQVILCRTRKDEFIQINVDLFNERVAIDLLVLNSLNDVVVIQRNELRHLIN